MRSKSLHLFFAFVAWLIAPHLKAQPGYLGHKKALELHTDFTPFQLYRHKGLPVKNISLRGEFVTSESASWVAVLGYAHAVMNQDDIDYYSSSYNLVYNPNTFDEQYLYSKGELRFSALDIGVHRRWYFTGAGALAPYGTYFGVGLTFSSIWNDLGLEFEDANGDGVNYPMVEPHASTAWTGNVFFGGKRIIGDAVILGWECGSGLCLKQSTLPRLAASYGNNTDPVEYQNNFSMRQFTNSRLFCIGLNVGILLP